MQPKLKSYAQRKQNKIQVNSEYILRAFISLTYNLTWQYLLFIIVKMAFAVNNGGTLQ